MVSFYRKLARWLIGSHAPEAEREMVEIFTDAYKDASPPRRIGLAVTAFVDLVLTRRALSRRRPPKAFAAGLATDIKVVFRELRSRTTFGILVVATLALGIGANTAIFSVVHAVLLRPLPLANAERVLVPVAFRGEDPFQVSAFDYLEWKRTAKSFSSFGLSTTTSVVLEVDGEPRPVAAARTTPGYFETLGARPILGRDFVDDDCCRESPVAVLGHGLWQRVFGGSDDVLGESLVLDDTPHAVIGVMPPDIDLPFGTELWIPLPLDELEESARLAHDYFAVLALSEVVSADEGRAELRAIGARLAASYPDTHAGWMADAITLREHMLSDFDGRVAPSLAALLVSVGLLLLIACANVSNLFLTRSMDRGRDLSVRTALGATSIRLVRHLAIETLVLAALGGAAALALARWLLPVLARVSPIAPIAMAGRLQAIELDGAVIAFTLAVTLVAGVGLGLVSVLQISQARLASALRSARESVGRRRVMNALVVVQMAVAVCLAIGAGLTASSLARLRSLSLGFEPEGLVAARVLFVDGDALTHPERVLVIEESLDHVRALPGVVSAGVATNLPADHLSWDAVYTPRGGTPFDPRNVPLVADRIVSPGYLETLNVELVAGRLLRESDRADGEPVVVITRDLGARAWPGQDALGKQIRRGAPDAETPWMTVVGVVEPVKEDRAAFRRDRPAWYLPYAQLDTDRRPTIVARATGDVDRLRVSLEKTIREQAVALVVYDVFGVENHMDAILSGERFGAGFVSVFSTLGLALAALGIYGVSSSAVASRRREIGLRMALGADGRRLVRRFTGEGLVLAAKGVALGLLGALVAGRLLSALLYQVHPADPGVFALAAALGIAVALAAAYGPARRATAVDAARAIRGE